MSRQTDRSGGRLAATIVATCALSLALGAAPASAAVSCSLSVTTLTVTLGADGDTAVIRRSGNDIGVSSGTPSAAVACTGAPTVTNTDLIVVNDASGGSTNLTISTGGGALAPGKTDEAGLSDEIEIHVDLGGGPIDTLSLSGSAGSDSWRLGKTTAAEGVNLNAGSESSVVVPGRDSDLEYSGVDGRLLVSGGPSGDSILASGGPQFTGPLAKGIEYGDTGSQSGNDTVAGGDGNDILDAGIGDDHVTGGAHEDVFSSDAHDGDDDIDGGGGIDRLEFLDQAGQSLGSLRVDLRLTSRQDTGVLGHDAIARIEDLRGGNGDDVLIGTDGDNVIVGADGADLIEGLGGAIDNLFAGGGVDTVSYAGAGGGVTADLEATGPQDTGGAGTDQYVGDPFENVIGGPFADTLSGSAAANRFEVRDGEGDTVTCRGDDDTVVADVVGVDTIASDCETRQFDLRPDTQITSGPPSLASDPTPTFAFTASKAGATFECSLDGSAFSPCESPHTRAVVSDGAHSFAVRARDLLGALDLSPATRAFTVDTSAAVGDASAFGAKTLVMLALAARRIPAAGPLPIRLANANGFAVSGRLSGQTAGRVSVSRRRVVKLRSRSFTLAAGARRTVKLALPAALRRLLARTGKLTLRLSARISDPAGNTRTVRKTVAPRLRRTRRSR